MKDLSVHAQFYLQKYQPYAVDPNLSGALASVLWELSLLSKHYHYAVSTMASSISSLSTSHNQVYLSTTSPQQALIDLSIERESFNPKNNHGISSHKRKRGSESSTLSSSNRSTQDLMKPGNEDKVRQRFSEHFMVLRDIAENERLRRELNRTTSSIRLYEEYKKQKKMQGDLKQRRKKIANH